MATTPNFGWSTPDNTGLVKNGALDIRTLGNSIDASLLDLKGGTTNQVLAKNSNTDMDFKWVSDATGMTNPMTTTGDTIYSSSGSTPARLGIGSTGQVLTVSGGVPTWATPTSGTPAFVGATAYRTANQSFTGGVATAVLLTDENYDTDAFHSTSTNTSRFTIPSGKGGKYSVTYNLRFEAVGSFSIVYLYKNGSAFQTNTGVHEGQMWNTSGIAQCSGSIQLDLVATDYIEVFAAIETTYNLIKARVSIQYLGA